MIAFPRTLDRSCGTCEPRCIRHFEMTNLSLPFTNPSYLKTAQQFSLVITVVNYMLGDAIPTQR